MSGFVDIGVNLTDKQFAGDRDAVIERARSAGVEMMILTGTSLDGSRAAADLAASRPGVLYATAGVHPHGGSSWSDQTAEAIEELYRRPEVVAIGECGLDFNRNFSPPEAQMKAFEAQLEIAARLEAPVFLHERDAHQALVATLRRFRDRIPRAVLHCFTGSAEELDAYLELDLHIGITGWICDERRGLHLRELVPRIPPDRLMIETDAPYLLPRTLRPRPKSRRNEPAYLGHVAEVVAGCLDVDAATLARNTAETARSFFGLARDPES